MDRRKLTDTLAEARRFIERAETAPARASRDERIPITATRDTAAVRRASLDLTMALADLRRRED